MPLRNPADVVENGKPPEFGTPKPLDLAGNGIRSIEAFGNKYLIVAGPVSDQGGFALYSWAGPITDVVVAVSGVSFDDFRPEALMVIPESNKVQILSDDGSSSCNDEGPVEQRAFRSIDLTNQFLDSNGGMYGTVNFGQPGRLASSSADAGKGGGRSSGLPAARLPIRLFEGWRSPRRQRYLYEQGRTRPGSTVTYARGWESYHQYGLACDFVGFVDGNWTWTCLKPLGTSYTLSAGHTDSSLSASKLRICK